MKVKDLLSSFPKWTRGNTAYDDEGYRISPYDENAVCWCLYGAVQRCYPYDEQRTVVLEKIRSYLNASSTAAILSWNDSPTTGFRDVKKLVNELDI